MPCRCIRAFNRVGAFVGGMFTVAVSSARNAWDRNDAAQMLAKVATASTGAATIWAGLKHAWENPDVKVALVTGGALFMMAFFEGVARYRSGPVGPPPGPEPAAVPPPVSAVVVVEAPSPPGPQQ